MKEQQKTHISKLLSLVLRHSPQTIGITLDDNGWVGVTELLAGLKQHNEPLTTGELEEIVATNNKKRFAFNEEHTHIRASQGHSVEVDLNIAPKQPPALLYHGTIAASVGAIKVEGLQKMSRQHVHLSADIATAEKVASRHGKPLVLSVISGEMFTQGYVFYQSENGVWLTDSVPPYFINFNGHEQ